MTDIDNVYSQRNALAVAFCKAALAAGWKAGRGFDSDPRKDWSEAWRHVVYVELPGGRQVSWHMAPNDLRLLEGLPVYEGTWDGTYDAKVPNWCLFDREIQPVSPEWDNDIQKALEDLLDSHEGRYGAERNLRRQLLSEKVAKLSNDLLEKDALIESLRAKVAEQAGEIERLRDR